MKTCVRMRYNERNGASATNTHAAPNHRPGLAGATAVAQSKPIPLPTPEQIDRFWSFVAMPQQPSCCWEWQGRRSRNRYGSFAYFAGPSGSRKQRNIAAHRVAYRILVGEIPDGLVLDHLCRNILCVNPDHLRPVPERVNLLSGYGPPALNSRKTHCKRGHEFTEENTYWQRGTRQCRQCKAARSKAGRKRWTRTYTEKHRERINARKREYRLRLRLAREVASETRRQAA